MRCSGIISDSTIINYSFESESEKKFENWLIAYLTKL